jgi:hypothetical protein
MSFLKYLLFSIHPHELCCHSNLCLHILRFTTDLPTKFRQDVELPYFSHTPQHMNHVVFSFQRKRLTFLLRKKISFFLMNCSLQNILQLDELDMGKRYNAHLHITSHHFRFYSIANYIKSNNAS